MSEASFHSEYLPATGAVRQELVLLHGWASSLEVWRPLLTHLRAWANVTLIDLPGSSCSHCDFGVEDLDRLSRAILAQAPPQAVYVGWSLGGQLAAHLAATHPSRVTALATFCSNPRFVGTPDWPGVEPALLAGFRSGLELNPASALRRFDSLQTRGSDSQRGLLRQLGGMRRTPDQLQLLSGLALLENLDLREALAGLVQPQLHCCAAQDALVPGNVCEQLGVLLGECSNVQIVALPELSHVALLEAPHSLAGLLYDFLAAQARIRPGCDSLCLSQEHDGVEPTSPEVAKVDVAHSFSRAAGQYDSAAKLQQEVGARLLDSIRDLGGSPQTMMDLGCGTGFFTPHLLELFPGVNYVGVDLAEGMVDFARGHHPGAGLWLVGDAEGLPLKSQSFDLIFSSLAMQWCYQPTLLFAELGRVLRRGGRCVFTSLGPRTLHELRASWAAVDAHRHVNTFLSSEDLELAAATVPGVRLRLHSEQFQMEYDSVRELLNELKTLGAHNMNRGRQTGLTGRRALQGMLAAYESWRREGKLPATYEVLFGVLEKL